MSMHAFLAARALLQATRVLLQSRRRSSLVSLALMLTTFILGTSVAPAPAQAAQQPGIRATRSFFGLHDGSGQAYSHLDFGSLRLWDAGVTWRDIETSPGVYDWSRLDSLVTAAQAHHVNVTLVLAMTPLFYADHQSLPPGDPSTYARFVAAAMSRYRSFNGHRGIAAYQVWNEGNVSNFWTGTPEQLAQMTAIVDHVRDQVDPGATVVAPSFAVRQRYLRAWMGSYQRAKIDGHPVWDDYDVNALSLYPKPTYRLGPGGPEDAMRLLGKARRQLHRIGVPESRKMWATEINYGVIGGAVADNTATPISEDGQVANVLRTYLLGAARGLSRVFWYRYDWGRVANGGTLGNTLLSDPDDATRIRAAGLALGTAQRWLHGRLVGQNGHPPCDRDSRGTYTCVVHYSGGVRKIYWNPRGGADVEVRGAGLVQDQGGHSTKLGTSTTVRVGYRPVMVDWRR